jgi:carboxyl-terminal processing protease
MLRPYDGSATTFESDAVEPNALSPPRHAFLIHLVRERAKLPVMRRTAALFVAFLSLQVTSLAQAPSPAQNLLDRALTALERNYFGFKSLDFAQVELDAEQKLDTACASQNPCPVETGSSVLDDVLAGIGDGHTFRLSANRYAQFNADATGARLPMVGLKFDALPDAAALVITRVREGSPAERAGLKRGDVVTSAGGRDLGTFRSASAATDFITALEFAAKPFQLTVSSLGGAARVVQLAPEPMTPWLPSYTLRADNIAVITFYQFLTNNQIASRVHDFVRQAQRANAKAIILDVRGSGGGSAFESMGSAGAFVDQAGVSFQSKFGGGLNVFQNGEIKDTGFKIANPARWTGPVVVLTNRVSRSAAEYMTYFLQRPGRAQVIGEPTAGVLNTSTTVSPLPDGGAIAVTSGRSSTPDGEPHPERITPNIILTDDMAALARGRDLVLERAVQVLTQP